MAKKKKLTDEQKAKKNRERAKYYRDKKKGVESRKNYENSRPPSLTKNLYDLVPDSEGLTPGQVYKAMGWLEDQPPQHHIDQMFLPGMESRESGEKAGLISGPGTLPDVTTIDLPESTQRHWQSEARLPPQPAMPQFEKVRLNEHGTWENPPSEVPPEGYADYPKDRDNLEPVPEFTQVRWEHMHPDHQNIVIRNFAKHGATIETMFNDVSTQLDRAMHLARTSGAPFPAGGDFYHGPSDNTPVHVRVKPHPRTAITDAASSTGVPPEVMTASIAGMSPKLNFRSDVHGNLPNVEVAEGVVDRTISGESLRKPYRNSATGKNHGVIYANAVRTGAAVARMLGMNLPPWKSTYVTVRQSGLLGRPSQDKTSAFSGGFLDPESPNSFTVVDTHSAASALPHMQKLDRDELVETPGAKLLIDHVFRMVAKSRGLQSVHVAQAVTWAQQRIESNTTPKATVDSHYGPSFIRQANAVRLHGRRHGQEQDVPHYVQGQGTLF